MQPYDNCQNLYFHQLTILSGAAVTEGMATQGYALVGIIMPAGWTAAAIGFQTSHDGVNFKPVCDNGGNFITATVKVVATVPKNVAFPETDQAFGPFLLLSSVTVSTETGVNQGADRVLTCVFRKLFS